MAKTTTKTQKLTILLIRDSIKKAQDALRSPANYTHVSLKTGTPYSGDFWYATPVKKTPSWQPFVELVLSSPPRSLFSATSSAALFVAARGRLFALTFGYGRNLLKADSFELGFGLKVALNRIDPRRIRSLDLKTYEDMVLSTKKQASTHSEIGTFGLDVARDLVRAVTGEPADASFAKRVTGADACTVNVAITAGGLGKKCEQLLDAYKDTKYKAHFDWIDHLSEVRDKITVDQLNARLIAAVTGPGDDKLHLAPAEPVDWQSIDKFRIGGTGKIEYDDLNIDEYLKNLGDKKKALSVQHLKSCRVSVRWSGTDQFANAWSVFNCIVWETSFGGRQFSLVDGTWFEIEASFSKRVAKFVAQLPKSTLTLPAAKAGEREEDYNLRVAAADARLVCLDQDLVKPADAATQIEFCDLLSKSSQLIHVKKKTRSATLSHLFSQGTVAAREFLQDGAIRDQVISYLKGKRGKTSFAALIPPSGKRPTPNEWEIAYAVIAKPSSTWPASLPFFSQLNLMQHAKLLQGLGFRVTLQLVEEH